eukprot:3188872-Heterocapsa_arctica.AAC.1
MSMSLVYDDSTRATCVGSPPRAERGRSLAHSRQSCASPGFQASQVLKRQSRQGCASPRCSGRGEILVVELIAVV